MNTTQKEYTQKLYKHIASKICARLSCLKNNNTEWFDKHTESIEYIAKKFLPHGSGFDCGCTINLERSNADKIVIDTSYHFMNNGGYYDGWEDYTIIITPSLMSGFNMRIVGKNRDDIKDYIYDCFEYPLNEEVSYSDCKV